MQTAELYRIAIATLELAKMQREVALMSLDAIGKDPEAGEYQLQAKRAWAKEMDNPMPKGEQK